jgi:hypothetical protein
MKMKMDMLAALRQEIIRVHGRGPCEDVTKIESFVYGDRDEKTGASFSVRNLGDWEVPADEEDDGDYDWKVPTAATKRMLDTLVKKYPGTMWENEGEKNWLRFVVR